MPRAAPTRHRGARLACVLVAGLVALALAVPAEAGGLRPDERLDDPALEARARAISKELRCVVCQNQSIDDSDAPLAQDLRRMVRRRLLTGDSDRAVIAHVHERYGDFVLLRPPVRPTTWLLWFGPPLLLVGAAGYLALRLVRRRSVRDDAAPVAPLDAVERARLDALLGEDRHDRRPEKG